MVIKKCLLCKKRLIKFQKKFCSRHCAATVNNKKRKIKKYCLFCKKILVKRNKYCSYSCQRNFFYKKSVNEWKLGIISGTCFGKNLGCNNFVREYLFKKYNSSCQKCGWSKINKYTSKIPLDIHHIDGDASNNTETNLQLLCKNCHSLTKNYGSLNKNSSRKSRYAGLS